MLGGELRRRPGSFKSMDASEELDAGSSFQKAQGWSGLEDGSPEIIQTQEVGWRESPRRLKPHWGHDKARVRSLKSQSDKENRGLAGRVEGNRFLLGRAKPRAAGGDDDGLSPTPCTLSSQGTKRRRAFNLFSPEAVMGPPSAKVKTEAPSLGMSLLGGLGRTLTQGRAKLRTLSQGLWAGRQPSPRASQSQSQDGEFVEDKAPSVGVGEAEAVKEDADADLESREEGDAIDVDHDEGTKEFLDVLSQLEERLSQDHDDGGARSGRRRSQVKSCAQMFKTETVECSGETDGAGEPSRSPDAVVGPHSEPTQSQSTVHAVSERVCSADKSAPEVKVEQQSDNSGQVNSPSSSLSTTTQQTQQHPTCCARTVPSPIRVRTTSSCIASTTAPVVKSWDQDDECSGWTEDDWVKVLELTQAGASQPASATDKTISNPAPVEAIQVPGLDEPRPESQPRATSRGAAKPKECPYPWPLERLEVIEVFDRREGRKVDLRVRQQDTGLEGHLVVGDAWSECVLLPGDVVHLLYTRNSASRAEASDEFSLRVDDDENYLIVHPDLLATPSSIITAVECDRRAVIQDRVSSSAWSSQTAVMGQVKHSMMQEMLLLLNNRKRMIQRLVDGSIASDLEQLADTVIAKNRVTLYGVGIPEREARQELLDLIRPLVEWARLSYVRAPRCLQPPASQAKPVVAVHRTVKVEENIWSLSLGLKGQIDVTLDAESLDTEALPLSHSQVVTRALVPLEVKSGRKTDDSLIRHKAQVMLYALLLRDRYEFQHEQGLLPSTSGILTYINNRGVDTIPVVPHDCELRSLLVTRNRVVQALKAAHRAPLEGEVSPLPPVLQRPNTCARCFQVAECMVYHKALEAGTEDTSGNPELFRLVTGHMCQADKAYFTKWERLISLEAAAMGAGRGVRAWHRDAREEEARTSCCISDMVCVAMDVKLGILSQGQDTDQPCYSYTFSRHTYPPDAPLSSLKTVSRERVSLLELAIGVGERVLISTTSRSVDDGGSTLRPFRHAKVSAGTVTSLSETSVEIICAQPLAVPGHPNFARGATCRAQPPPLTAGPAGLALTYDEGGAERSWIQTKPIVVFRIDRDNSSMNIGMMRENLIRLFTGAAVNVNCLPGGDKARGLRLEPLANDDKLRRLVVLLEKPTFSQEPSPTPVQAVSLIRCSSLVPPSGCGAQELREEFKQLNPDQQAAVEKALTANDYALLFGMPGTGKTATITFVCRALLCRGKSVLITSYTHSAVDHLLLKLKEKRVQFLRLGRASQVNRALHDHLLEAGDTLKSPEALQSRLNSAQLIGTTCLGVRHAALASRRFDVCIVDEAGQTSQPVCLGPVRLCKTFILVGDDNQLPPLVLSPQAAKEGMTESLFARLAAAHPHAVQRLTFQYRMNRDIVCLCNDLVYGGQLKCGTEQVANSRLGVPHLGRVRSLMGAATRGWLEDVLLPVRRVVFIDTDAVSEAGTAKLEEGLVGTDKEGAQGPSNLTNPTEARAVCQLVTALLLAGVQTRSVAVISPLRAQLKLLKRTLAHLPERIDVNTIDKYQGMDRDCIIISLVRSNPDGKVGDLLQDRRRVNVAISRAKRKLILVGSASTLANGHPFKVLLETIQREKWLVSLTRDALEHYNERGERVMSSLLTGAHSQDTDT